MTLVLNLFTYSFDKHAVTGLMHTLPYFVRRFPIWPFSVIFLTTKETFSFSSSFSLSEILIPDFTFLLRRFLSVMSGSSSLDWDSLRDLLWLCWWLCSSSFSSSSSESESEVVNSVLFAMGEGRGSKHDPPDPDFSDGVDVRASSVFTTESVISE